MLALLRPPCLPPAAGWAAPSHGLPTWLWGLLPGLLARRSKRLRILRAICFYQTRFIGVRGAHALPRENPRGTLTWHSAPSPPAFTVTSAA